MKTNDDLIAELKQHLSRDYVEKGWTAVTQGIVEDLLTQKDAEVARERERIVEYLNEREEALAHEIKDCGLDFLGATAIRMYEVRKIRDEIKSLITNKGDTNN